MRLSRAKNPAIIIISFAFGFLVGFEGLQGFMDFGSPGSEARKIAGDKPQEKTKLVPDLSESELSAAQDLLKEMLQLVRDSFVRNGKAVSFQEWKESNLPGKLDEKRNSLTRRAFVNFKQIAQNLEIKKAYPNSPQPDETATAEEMDRLQNLVGNLSIYAADTSFLPCQGLLTQLLALYYPELNAVSKELKSGAKLSWPWAVKILKNKPYRSVISGGALARCWFERAKEKAQP